MRALMLKGSQELALESIASPAPRQGEVIVDVEITGLGGSEIAALLNPGLRPLPNVMGHGLCGLTRTGQRVAVFPLSGCETCLYCNAGQHQLCNDWKLIGVQKPGGFAEQVAIPKSALVPLPAALSWEQASFIEPFANAVNAWERAQPKSTDSVMVIGAGSLGLGVTAMAQNQKCKSIFVSDLSAKRLQAALSFGACEAVGNFSEDFDIVFDTVGTEETRNQCINRTKKNGESIFLGFAEQSLTIDFTRMIREQKTLIGSFVFSRQQFVKAMELVRGCCSEWVRNLSFDEVADELTSYADGNYKSIKSALRPRRTVQNPGTPISQP
ncbi:MAG: alcohol dehydrogenase catalytic domain-containing protein [Pseudomonadales bacterium]|nr:alcohol dehydrogenase catalytic domain-containing protein [Pseudomonadales bacterium]